MRKLLTIAAAAAALAIPVIANGATTTGTSLSYEFDDGTNWTLQKNTAALTTTYPNRTYSDAGIVVDLGPAQDFDGLTWEGTGPLSANIWLGDGSEASTPGTHALSDGVDFSYGPWDGGAVTFWTGPEAGNTLTADQISALPDTEVYAWIGLVYDGSDNVSGSISSVDGRPVGNRAISFTKNGDEVTAALH